MVFAYEILLRGVHEQVYAQGFNGGKIQAMGTYHYFIVRHIALLGVSDYCVLKKNVCPFPMNIFIFKSYILDSISCTGFVGVMGYKSLLLDARAVTSLLVCRIGVGGVGGVGGIRGKWIIL